MKLGLMTAILPDLSLEEIAAWASQNSFEMLEVCAWPPGKAERRYAGVTHLVTMPWYFYAGPEADLAGKLDGIKRFADDIIAKW